MAAMSDTTDLVRRLRGAMSANEGFLLIYEAADMIERLSAPAPHPMRCERCGTDFADRQPGSLCPKCHHELTAAPAPDAATVKDAARLDFLHAEAQKHQVQFAKSLYGTGIELALGYQNVRVVNGDLRTAIDDAMKEQK